jgi:spore coat polysaccharide biosynthesis protein SpsF (cytidylyltransferase family)
MAIKLNKDYCSNTLIENYPDGQDIEVFKFSALEKAWSNAILNSDREHVTPYIIKNSDFKGENLFTAVNFDCFKNYSNVRMTVDEVSDFKLIEVLIKNLGANKTWEDYTNFIINNNLIRINGEIIRNEGYLKSLNKD